MTMIYGNVYGPVLSGMFHGPVQVTVPVVEVPIKPAEPGELVCLLLLSRVSSLIEIDAIGRDLRAGLQIWANGQYERIRIDTTSQHVDSPAAARGVADLVGAHIAVWIEPDSSINGLRLFLVWCPPIIIPNTTIGSFTAPLSEIILLASGIISASVQERLQFGQMVGSLIQAICCIEQNNPLAAISACDATIALLSAQPVAWNLALLYFWQAVAHYQTQQWPHVIQDLDRAIQSVHPFPTAMLLRGIAHLANGNPLQALADFEALTQFVQLHNRIGQTILSLNIANAALQANQVERAAQIVSTIRQQSRTLPEGIERFLTGVEADVAFAQAQYEKAEQYYRRLLMLCEQAHDQQGHYRGLIGMALSFKALTHFKQALDLIQQAQILAQKQGWVFEQAQALMRISMIQQASGDPAQAHEALWEAYALLRKAKHPANADVLVLIKELGNPVS